MTKIFQEPIFVGGHGINNKGLCNLNFSFLPLSEKKMLGEGKNAI